MEFYLAIKKNPAICNNLGTKVMLYQILFLFSEFLKFNNVLFY